MPAFEIPDGIGGVEGDLGLLGDVLERTHPRPFRHVTRRRFHAELERVVRRAYDLDRNELLVELMRLLALLGPRNGHTGIFPLDPRHRRHLRLYPIRLYEFADGVFVVGQADGEDLVGHRLVGIAGVPVRDVVRRVAPLVPHDSRSTVRARAPCFCLVAEILDGVGVGSGTARRQFAFERPDGKRVEAVLRPLRRAAYESAFADPRGADSATLPRRRTPFYLAQSKRDLWVTPCAEGRALYVGYNTTRVPTTRFARRLERLVASRGVKRAVVDLRLNGGGDNRTYGPLLDVLRSPTVNRPGRLYVLIGRATFSAAANFAAELQGETCAVFVGEPTGGGVNQYGDPAQFALPATGWNVQVPTLYHQKGAPDDKRLAVEPDVAIEPRASDFFGGRDPVLDAATAA